MLNLMRPRMEIIRSLLSEDGSLWIAIDDNERDYLKVMCDEIFGRNSFVTSIAWQSRYSRSNDAIFSLSHRSPRTIIQRWEFEDRCTIKFRVVKFLINDPDTGKDAWEVLVTNRGDM